MQCNKYPILSLIQYCLTFFCNPMDYTVHEILQARILEWVAFPFSRGSSQPRDRTQVSRAEGGFFTSWVTREAQGRSPGEGNGNPLQYSCLDNPKDRGSWQTTVHRVTRVGHDLALSFFLINPVLFIEHLLHAQHSTTLGYCCLIAQSCPTLCDPIAYSPPGSSVMGFSRQEYWSGLPFGYTLINKKDMITRFYGHYSLVGVKGNKQVNTQTKKGIFTNLERRE